MKFELFKIIKPEHADGFIQGNLYINSLEYFRGVERNSSQGDYQEGTYGKIKKTSSVSLDIDFQKQNWICSQTTM